MIALPTVILAFMFGQSRIFFVMARDGLLPRALAEVSARIGAPVRMTLATAVVVGGAARARRAAGRDRLAGQRRHILAAFIAVAASMLVLRRRDPGAVRTSTAPRSPGWSDRLADVCRCLYLVSPKTCS